MHEATHRITPHAALFMLCGAAAWASVVSGCGWARGTNTTTPSGTAAPESRTAAISAAAHEPTVTLARTRVTNQTGTRCRVQMAVIETPLTDASGNQAMPRWWWGEPVVLTATTTEDYRLEALAADKAPVAGKRSVLVKIETLLGTRVETLAWYNIVGPMPPRLEMVRDGDDVVPAVPMPTTIETLARDLWPTPPEGAPDPAHAALDGQPN